MSQFFNRFKEILMGPPQRGPGQPSRAWKLTRRGEVLVTALLAIVVGVLAIVFLGMLFRFW